MIVTNKSILKQKSKPVTFWNLTKVKEEILPKLLKKATSGLGLSAIQLGIPLKIFVIKLDTGEWLTVINPKIISVDKVFLSRREGCLSLPGIRVNVERYYQISAEYRDKDFKKREAVFIGVESICFQHEYDHLEGILITDKEVKIEPMMAHKIGRNQPCPCGSGKKYKKCCLPKESNELLYNEDRYNNYK